MDNYFLQIVEIFLNVSNMSEQRGEHIDRSSMNDN